MSECKNTVFHQNVCDGIENAEHSDCHECGAIALQSEVYRLRDELEKATEEISDLQFTVQKEWEARNRFQVLYHDASSELSRLREEISMLRSTWKAPRDCEEERGMSEIGRGMKSLRCKRCGKSPRGKIQTENRKRYDPYCDFNCQEWAKTEYAQRYISKSRSHMAGRGGA